MKIVLKKKIDNKIIVPNQIINYEYYIIKVQLKHLNKFEISILCRYLRLCNITNFIVYLYINVTQ